MLSRRPHGELRAGRRFGHEQAEACRARSPPRSRRSRRRLHLEPGRRPALRSPSAGDGKGLRPAVARTSDHRRRRRGDDGPVTCSAASGQCVERLRTSEQFRMPRHRRSAPRRVGLYIDHPILAPQSDECRAPIGVQRSVSTTLSSIRPARDSGGPRTQCSAQSNVLDQVSRRAASNADRRLGRADRSIARVRQAQARSCDVGPRPRRTGIACLRARYCVNAAFEPG